MPISPKRQRERDAGRRIVTDEIRPRQISGFMTERTNRGRGNTAKREVGLTAREFKGFSFGGM